jgi:hypothetical protein
MSNKEEFSQSEHHNEVERNQNKILLALDRVVAELKQDYTKHQPTKMEQIIEVFKAKLSTGNLVSVDDLVHLFEGSDDPRQAASSLIFKLNARMKKHGVKAKPVPAYQLTLE